MPVRCPRNTSAAVAALVAVLCIAAPASAQRVRQVIDGDTITVSGVGVVRLIGVDAPEKTGGTYRQSEPFGDAATRFMRELLAGQDVRLEYDGPRKDPYDRTLAYVFLRDGRLANLEIIRAGYAETYRRFSYRRKDEFLAAERQAQEAKRGMWATRRPRRGLIRDVRPGSAERTVRRPRRWRTSAPASASPRRA